MSYCLLPLQPKSVRKLENREVRTGNQGGRPEPECRPEVRSQQPIQFQLLSLQRLLERFELFQRVGQELHQQSLLTTGYGRGGQPTYVQNYHCRGVLQIE